MKSDNAIRNGTKHFCGHHRSHRRVRARRATAAASACCLLRLGLYVLHYLRGSPPAVPKKKAKAPRRAKFVVPDIEDEPLSDILLLHVNQRITAALRTAGSNITWEWATKDPLTIVKEGGRCLIRVHGLDGFESARSCWTSRRICGVNSSTPYHAPESHGRRTRNTAHPCRDTSAARSSCLV